MTDKTSNIKHYPHPFVRVTAFQDPKSMQFIPVIEFVGENEELVTVNSYQANILVHRWEDAISMGLNVASYLNLDMVQFNDIGDNNFEIVVWDKNKKEHDIVTKSFVPTPPIGEEFDIPESMFVHRGTGTKQ